MKIKFITLYLLFLFFLSTLNFNFSVVEGEDFVNSDISSRVDNFYVPSEYWNKTYGGSDDDIFKEVCLTSDGGFVAVGTTYTYDVGGGDFYIVKVDSSGSKNWVNAFGGPDMDLGYSVSQTSDNGYIMTGQTRSYGGSDDDVWLVKTDSDGNKEWDKVFGGSDQDFGRCVRQCSDGGYIITGTTNSYASVSDLWLIKTDSSGTREWDKTFSGRCTATGMSVKQTKYGGYIITGETEPSTGGNYDVYLIKTDLKGDLGWSRYFGSNGWEKGEDVIETDDGGYAVFGWTSSFGSGSDDVWLIKTDSFGIEDWNKTYGGEEADYGNSGLQAVDGGYVIAGETQSYGGGRTDAFVIRIGSTGDLTWKKMFGGLNEDVGYSVDLTDNGYYVIGGYTQTYGTGKLDGWLIRLNEILCIRPTPVFSYTPSAPTDLDTIEFTDESYDSDGYIKSWFWDFGDGSTSTEQEPSHKFADNGTYKVSLTVTDDDGAPGTLTKDISVLNVAPTANFSYYPSFATSIEEIQFLDESNDPDGVVVSWFWDFGDGYTSVEQDPQHKFARNGIFTISLTVEDNDGEKNSVVRDTKINNLVPEVAFVYEPKLPNCLGTVNFTGTATDKDGTVKKWYWDFGDGGTSSEQNPKHQFTSKGKFKVTLSVEDDDGEFGVAEEVITIYNVKPVSKFSCKCVSGATANKIQFTDESTDPDGKVATWSWDFGDGEVSSQQSPVHVYKSQGTYKVKFTVTDDDGDTTTLISDVNVQYPDLHVEKKDVILSNYTPANGDLLVIILKIQNSGIIAVEDVLIYIYIDDKKIHNATIDIGAQEFTAVETSWAAETGYHEIHVEIDPFDEIRESIKNNNDLIYSLTVKEKKIGETGMGDPDEDKSLWKSIFGESVYVVPLLLIVTLVIFLVVLIVIARRKEEKRSQAPDFTSDKYYCNVCEAEVRYKEIQGKWFCEICNMYIEHPKSAEKPKPKVVEAVFDEPKAAQPFYQQPAAASYQGPSTWGQVQAPSPTPQAQPAPSQYPCRTCNKPLTYVNQYKKWYCHNCKKYA